MRHNRLPQDCHETHRRPQRPAVCRPQPPLRAARRSNPRLGRAHQDSAALLTAHHLVLSGRTDPGEIGLVELELASAAAALDQRGGAEPGVLLPNALVQGHEVVRQAGGDLVALLLHVGALALDLGERLVPLGRQVADLLLRFRTALLGALQVALEALGALHDLQLDLLELVLSPGERLQLVLHALEVFRAPLTGVEPLLRTRRAVPDELDVLVGLGDLALDVGKGRTRQDDLLFERRGTGGGLVELLQDRQRALPVSELVEASVELLQIEQSPLEGQVSFQRGPPGIGLLSVVPDGTSVGTTKSHGSVHRRDT